MKGSLLTFVETLPPELQAEVCKYALSLRKTPLPQNRQDQPLIFDMHKGLVVIAEDFDEPLPDAFSKHFEQNRLFLTIRK